MTITDRSGGVASAGNPTMTDRRTGIMAGIAIKAPCRAASTAALTLSGEQTVDGVACVTGDRVLVKDQAATATNGIYVVSTGAWTRATDFDSVDEIATGTLVFIATGGTANGQELWEMDAADPTTIDSSAMTFSNATFSSTTGAAIATWLADPTSTNLRAAMTDETGSGALVFGTAPIFTTNLTVPLVIGGAAGGSTLTLKSTSGVGSSDGIVFQVGNNGATEGMRIDAGGQIIKGHTAALTYASITPSVQLNSLSAVTIIGQAKWSNDAFGSAISFLKSRGTTVGSYTTVQNGDTLGTISFRGAPGSSAITNAAAILGEVDGTPGASNDMPGRLVFQTTPDGSGTLTEAFRVNNAQQINIATTTDATSVTTGSLITAGGVGVSKAIFGGTSIKSVSPTAGVGYATGAGGTVTQATDKTTGVTLNKVCGAITMNGAALNAGVIVSFVLTNSAIAATDVLVLNHISGGTIGAYTLNAQAGAGSATINVRNNTAGNLSEAIVIQFAVIKGVNA